MTGLELRFDASRHRYTCAKTGEIRPSITFMMEQGGYTDSTWMNDAGRIRGTAVHKLTEQYDRGWLEEPYPSLYKGYLLAYIDATAFLRPRWTEIEETMIHPTLKFAGTADRAGFVHNLRTVAEIKSGAPAPAIRGRVRPDALQLALQAILLSGQGQGGLPAEHYRRLVIYVRADGGYSIDEIHDPHDFRVARRLIAEMTT